MNSRLYVATIRFIIDTPQNKEEVSQQLEYAVNTACTKLEEALPKHESISYKITDKLREI